MRGTVSAVGAQAQQRGALARQNDEVIERLHALSGQLDGLQICANPQSAASRSRRDTFGSSRDAYLATAGRLLPCAPRTAYVGGHRAWVRTTWGGKLLVDTEDLLLAPWLMLDGEWEPGVTRFLSSTIRQDDVFVDVGANVGYFTVLGARLVGWGGKVYAFEPHPAVSDLLKRTISANWMTTFVTLEAFVVYSECRSIDFFLHDEYPGNSSVGRASATQAPAAQKITVPAVALDDYFNAGRHRVDVIKVDVEGAEVAVFRGMRRLLTSNERAVIVCEWSPGQISATGDDPAELIEEFSRHRLSAFQIDNEIQSVPLSGLLDLQYANIALKRG